MERKYMQQRQYGSEVRIVEMLRNGKPFAAHCFRLNDRKSVHIVIGVSRLEWAEAAVVADKELSERDRQWLRFERDRHEGQPDPVDPPLFAWANTQDGRVVSVRVR